MQKTYKCICARCRLSLNCNEKFEDVVTDSAQKVSFLCHSIPGQVITYATTKKSLLHKPVFINAVNRIREVLA